MSPFTAGVQGWSGSSLVVAARVARAVRVLAEKGRADPAEFPLLFHVDAVLSGESDAELPWEKFTFRTF